MSYIPLIVSYSDLSGGAARAAFRLHNALHHHKISSEMMVNEKISDDWAVRKLTGGVIRSFRRSFDKQLIHLQKSSNLNLHSGAWLPSKWIHALNNSDADVVHLHWVAGETLSIEDIGRIQKPVVWTLHDMWAFCGSEHYAADDATARWRGGYHSNNRLPGDSGFDIDRLTWWRKQRVWSKIKPIHIVTPSQWLADCARQSHLFRHWPVSVIPNTLDTEIYKPLDRSFCRQALGIPKEKRIILFGAIGGTSNPIKGFDLLITALEKLKTRMDSTNLLCVVFGESPPKKTPSLPLETRWIGSFHDDITLSLLYNTANVVVIPSRQDNLPQTAVESQSCGCPGVAFNCSGLPDIIEHKKTGYLAHAFDPDDMAKGIRWILEDENIQTTLGIAARKRALQLWSSEMVVPQYLNIYREAIHFYNSE